MASLTTDQVTHIAMLARLALTPEETERLSRELTAILTFVDQLNEVSTDAVDPTEQVTGLSTVLRDDTVHPSPASPDALLACSPLPIIDHSIAAPHAHG